MFIVKTDNFNMWAKKNIQNYFYKRILGMYGCFLYRCFEHDFNFENFFLAFALWCFMLCIDALILNPDLLKLIFLLIVLLAFTLSLLFFFELSSTTQTSKAGFSKLLMFLFCFVWKCVRHFFKSFLRPISWRTLKKLSKKLQKF